MKRSKPLILVGLFLSKYDEDALGKLDVPSWNEAYGLFIDKLSYGREESSFINSLKNCRDAYDAYFPNSRKGW